MERKFPKALFIPVNWLQLSLKSKNHLMQTHIKYVGELVQWTEDSLRDLYRFDRTTLSEIRNALNSIDLCFGMELNNFPSRTILDRIAYWELDISSIQEQNTAIKFNQRIENPKSTIQSDRLYTPLDTLSLSAQSMRYLTRANIKYVGELVQWKEGLFSLYDFDMASVHEINNILKSMDLYLGMELKNFPSRRILNKIAKGKDKSLIKEEQNKADESDLNVENLVIKTAPDNLLKTVDTVEKTKSKLNESVRLIEDSQTKVAPNYLLRTIDALRLSVRSSNCLYKADIKYVGELVQLTEQELLLKKNFGRKCLYEVKGILSRMGLRLGLKLDGFPSREVLEKADAEDYNISFEQFNKTNVVGTKTVLRKELLIPINTLDLSVRSSNCLYKADIKYVGELVQLTEQELLLKKNFGRTSLREIREIVQSMDLRFGMKLDCFPERKELDRMCEQNTKTNLLPLFSDEQKKVISSKSNKIKTIAFETSSLEEELMMFIERIIVPKHSWQQNVSHQRDCRIVSILMGFDGTGTKSLETVGQEFSLTRERVRQIRSKFLKRVKQFRYQYDIELPFLDRVLLYIPQLLPARKDEVESSLGKEGLVKRRFFLDGIREAALLTQKTVPFEIVRYKTVLYAISPGTRRLFKTIVYCAMRAIEHYGIATIEDITAISSERAKQEITPEFVTSILSALSEIGKFSWLDKENGWFWSSNARRNQLITIIRKILSISGPIDVSVLRHGIGRSPRMRGFMPPSNVLLELCKQLSWCTVVGRSIEADLNCEEELGGTTEWIFFLILKEHGPVMKREDFETACIEQGMNRNTFFMYLTFSPIIHRYAIGVYGLRGAKVPPGFVESLVSEAYHHKRKTLLDFGWAEDGKIWIAHNISAGMLKNGLFTIPAAIKEYLEGIYILKTIDGTNIGNFTVKGNSGWNLGSFYKRRGAEEGDHLIILFDIGLKIARIAVSEDEDILAMFKRQDLEGYEENRVITKSCVR